METIHRIRAWYRKLTDPFGEMEKANQEKILERHLYDIQLREKILRAAMEKGDNVRDELEKMCSEIDGIKAKMPRGDSVIFAVLVSCCVVSFWMLVGLATNTVFTQLWDSLDNEYLREFQSGPVRIWRIGHWMGTSFVFWILLAILLWFIWRIQRRLRRKHARRVLGGMAFLVLFVLACFMLSFLSLLLQPLFVVD